MVCAAFISAMCNVSYTTIFYASYGIFTLFFLCSIEYWRYFGAEEEVRFCVCVRECETSTL